jgi:acetyltransferase-like isoleucine patch superfamily enzyme
MSFYTDEELKKIGLASFGENVLISRKASLYNTSRITIGNNVRIDDFTVLSAGDGCIEIGDYVHIAVFCSLIGAGKIKLMDFSNLSSRVSIYSSSDDFSGTFLTNPTVPSQFTNVIHQDVLIKKHVIIGSGAVVLPGITLEEGVAVGSLSLVTKSCSEFGVYAGIPAKHIKKRKQNLLNLEKQLKQTI